VISPAEEAGWQEGVGGLLLLAAANATALLSQLEAVLPMKPRSAARGPQSSVHHLFHPLRSLLLTLLFLPAVGLHRFWDLRSYTGRELALLTGRPHSYSYRHTERFLLQLSAARADQALTEALARWMATVWQVGARTPLASHHPSRRPASDSWHSSDTYILRAGGGTIHLNHLVVDREAMAADFLAQLNTEGRTLTTIRKHEPI
jgi:hypothetical protein